MNILSVETRVYVDRFWYTGATRKVLIEFKGDRPQPKSVLFEDYAGIDVIISDI